MDFKLSVLIAEILAVLAIQVSSNDIKELYTNGHSYSQYFLLEDNIAAERVLRFSVRAQQEARIVLAPSHKGDEPVYEIVLGAQDNTVNYIRGRCPCQEEHSATIRTVNLLSQHEFRNFWIKLKADGRSTLIRVGFGGQIAPFLEWRDTKPLKPQYLSFQSGTAAEWRYGYSDKAHTAGVSIDKRKSVVTSNGYGQYFPLSEVVSHSDDAVTLYFSISKSKQFQILLSPAVSYLGDVYEFELHDKGAYLRRQHLSEPEKIFQQDGFLNKRSRFGFWIKITKDGRVMLGKEASSNPILQWQDPSPVSPQFVSFSVYRTRDDDPDDNSISNLQYGLGPDYKLATQDCRPRWKEASGQQLPPGAVRGGRNNRDELFVCRANHGGHLVPGSFVPGKNHTGACQVSWGLYVYKETEFQVLTGCRFVWTAASLGEIPDGAISVDGTTGNTTLYVSRVAYEGQVIIGKLVPERLLAYIAYNNQKLPFTHYEVLVNRLAGY